MACCILKNSVSVSAERKRALRVAWDGEIRMIQEIERFCSQRDFRAFPHLETFLQRQIKLCKARAAQDIASGSAKLTGRRQCKCARIKPASRGAGLGAARTNAPVRIPREVGSLCDR